MNELSSLCLRKTKVYQLARHTARDTYCVVRDVLEVSVTGRINVHAALYTPYLL